MSVAKPVYRATHSGEIVIARPADATRGTNAELKSRPWTVALSQRVRFSVATLAR